MKTSNKSPKVISNAERLSYLRVTYKAGYKIFFKYPNWDYFMYDSKPHFVPECEYTIKRVNRDLRPEEYIVNAGI